MQTIIPCHSLSPGFGGPCPDFSGGPNRDFAKNKFGLEFFPASPPTSSDVP